MAGSSYKIPYDSRGNLLAFTVSYYKEKPEWRDNEPFSAEMTLSTVERLYSGVRFIWTDPEGYKYPMFGTDMADLIKRATINHGVVNGTWTVRKSGEYFGIKLVWSAS